MAEPIEIVIRKTSETSGQQQVLSNQSGKVKGSGLMKSAVAVALTNVGKDIAKDGFRQFISLSGRTNTLRMIENGLEVAGYINQVIVGGVGGAIVAGGQLTIKAVGQGISNYQANLNADLLYQRSGNATIDGGRGTYD
jgi:hypothetical protein